MTEAWYTSHTNLVELATWLNDEEGFHKPMDVIDFFEKPWHYQDEWERYTVMIDEKRALMAE